MRLHRVLVGLLLACTSAFLLAGIASGTASAAAPPCAELVFTSPIHIAPPTLIAGKQATITVDIKNTGKFGEHQKAGACNAGSFIAQFKLSPGASTAVSETVIPSLAENEEKELTFEYDFPKAGNYDTEVDLNPAKEVPEKLYLNDIKLDSITVSAAKADPVITNVSVTSLDPTSAVVEKRVAVADVTVENAGDIPTSPFYVQWTPSKSTKALTETETVPLEPGESREIFLEYTYKSKGPVSSKFVVSAAGRFTPFSTKTDEFTVEAALPNLRIAEVLEHPQFAGKASTIEVTVENDGNAGAGPFLVEWKPGAGQPAQIQQVNELAEGAVTFLLFSNVYHSAGTYEGTVTLDPTHKIKELFSTEKTAKTDLVIPEPTVDLTVTNISVTPSPVKQAQVAKIAVTVENIGNTESPKFVTAWNPNSAFGVSGSGSQTIAKEAPPLAAGGSEVVDFEYVYPKSGPYRSVAEVNYGRAVKETNYANNAMLDELNVEAAEIELLFSKQPVITAEKSVSGQKENELYINQKGFARFTIVNEGPIATGSFDVQFQQEKSGIKQTQVVSGLNPHETKEFKFKVSYSKVSEPGKEPEAVAIIDPAEVIKKTKAPDESVPVKVIVKKKAATITFSEPKIKVLYDPGNKKGANFHEWDVYLFAYDKGASCKVESKTGTGEKIKKTMANLAPISESDKDCPSTGFQSGVNPGSVLTVPSFSYGLTEEEPLYVKAKATSYNRNKKREETSAPGEALLKRTRAQYFEGLSGKSETISGAGCHDSNGQEEPEPSSPGFDTEGECFKLETKLTAASVGPAVRRSHGLVSPLALRAARPDAEGGEGEEGLENEEAEELANAKAAVEAGVEAVEELNRRLEEEEFPEESSGGE